jgi:hypothetical protein
LAAVLLSVPAPAGRGLGLLRRPGRLLLAAAAAVTTLTAMAIPLLGQYYGPPPAGTDDPGFNISFAVSARLANAVAVLTLVVVLGLILAAGIGADQTGAPPRRRLVVDTVRRAAATANVSYGGGTLMSLRWPKPRTARRLGRDPGPGAADGRIPL